MTGYSRASVVHQCNPATAAALPAEAKAEIGMLTLFGMCALHDTAFVEKITFRNQPSMCMVRKDICVGENSAHTCCCGRSTGCRSCCRPCASLEGLSCCLCYGSHRVGRLAIENLRRPYIEMTRLSDVSGMPGGAKELNHGILVQTHGFHPRMRRSAAPSRAASIRTAMAFCRGCNMRRLSAHSLHSGSVCIVSHCSL